MNDSITFPSFGKVNLTLRVLGKREDGFHELCTVFQTVSLHDTLTFSDDQALSLVCDDGTVPTGTENLILRAAYELRQKFGCAKGARIELQKRIPLGGGLGGGSSNAATALIGLSSLWRLPASDSDLRLIAARMGSDVPFFLTGGTAIGTGRGELIEPIDDIAEDNILIVTPDVMVSTADAYAALGAESLTNVDSKSILRVCRFESDLPGLSKVTLKNDFERTVFSAYPEIRRVKETLLELGAVNAAMSGSGASVFAIFDNIETRQAALKALDHESTWRKFAVATISRAEFREALRC